MCTSTYVCFQVPIAEKSIRMTSAAVGLRTAVRGPVAVNVPDGLCTLGSHKAVVSCSVLSNLFCADSLSVTLVF